MNKAVQVVRSAPVLWFLVVIDASITGNALAQCVDCQVCENTSKHSAEEGVESGNSEGSGHEHCSVIGDCFSGHDGHSWVVGGCEGGLAIRQDSFDAVTTALSVRAYDHLLSTVEPEAHRIVINEVRNAVQVLDCRGLVILHLPAETPPPLIRASATRGDPGPER